MRRTIASLSLAIAIVAFGGCGGTAAESASTSAARSSRVVGQGASASRVLWSGDFQTGTLGQWNRLQTVPGDIQVVPTPTPHDGRRFAALFTVHPGDNPIHSTGERAEAVASVGQTGSRPNTSAWYGWSTYFPPDFQAPPESWNIFTQWHGTLSDGCPPNLAFEANAFSGSWRISFRARGGRLQECTPPSDEKWNVANLEFGHWYDFVLHVGWSSNPEVGFVALWVNGHQVVPKTTLATLYVGEHSYLKQGFYRAPSSLTSTIYQAGMRRGTSYASVAG
jgi:polysaccharide lyase-like protein